MRLNTHIFCAVLLVASGLMVPETVVAQDTNGVAAVSAGVASGSIPATSVNAGSQVMGKGIDLIPIKNDLTNIETVNFSQDTTIIQDQARVVNLNALRATVDALMRDRNSALAGLNASLVQTSQVRAALGQVNVSTNAMNESRAASVASTASYISSASYYNTTTNCSLGPIGVACALPCTPPPAPAPSPTPG